MKKSNSKLNKVPPGGSTADSISMDATSNTSAATGQGTPGGPINKSMPRRQSNGL